MFEIIIECSKKIIIIELQRINYTQVEVAKHYVPFYRPKKTCVGLGIRQIIENYRDGVNENFCGPSPVALT